jgi:3-oxo-5-alpha-steroid 4-dehydrogenase 1
MTYETYQIINYAWIGLAVLIFLVLLKITAPFGRHTSKKWGVQVSNRLGWFFMELPGMLVIAYFLIANDSFRNYWAVFPVFFYLFHYVNRALIFPFRIHTKGKTMPLVVMLMAVGFNVMNGFLIGFYFGNIANYTFETLTELHFIVGAILFIVGVYINWKYDNRLIHLRKANESGYVIPTGGLFRYISCQNLLGEIVEWTGFALLCMNLPAFGFLIWTWANLVPRAMSHHKWYKSHFGNYPSERKAVFPFIL